MPPKKVTRTYARQKRSLYDEEPPTKRRRVECAVTASTVEHSLQREQSQLPDGDSEESLQPSAPPTSSPKTSPAIWSDEVPRSSPPSSPAPTSSPPPLQKRRPVFSLFRKPIKHTAIAKRPLLESSHHNARSLPTVPPAKVKPKQMVQMQLDLASESRKSCRICGMEYIPSNAEDASLHRRFHAMNVGGVDFTKATVERLRKKQVWSAGDGSFVAAVGRKDALALRHRTSDVLKVVNTELGAVPIPDGDLWSQTCAPDDADAKVEHCQSAPVDRFQTYLYIRDQKCIGACLAERIWDSYTVLAPDDATGQVHRLADTTRSSSISISAAKTRALLGISRIWTSNQHRKQGIATRLLDSARSNFLYGLTVEKDQVAFSQPTESGGNLARKWFQQDHGWRVYID
ncbi:hypothetical protein ACEQ8H_005289 [Pleosporales sp. CAS-2024a]